MKVPLLQTPAMTGYAGVVHGFTTREGGVSEAGLASLNLARRPSETPAALAENWRRVVASLSPALDVADLALVDQVHGSAVVTVERGAGPLATLGEADGLVTTEKGITLAVRVADCVPVLLAAPGGVGAAHAGWRGIAAGVVPATAKRLQELTSTPFDTWSASVGPCMSAAVYETGPDVVEALVRAGIPRERVEHWVAGSERVHTHLVSAVCWQLEQLGIGTIEVVGACTATSSNLFSHRADGPATGRLAGVIARCL